MKRSRRAREPYEIDDGRRRWWRRSNRRQAPPPSQTPEPAHDQPWVARSAFTDRLRRSPRR